MKKSKETAIPGPGIPGEILVNEIPKAQTPEEMEVEARNYLKRHQGIREAAIQKGEDLVAYATSHGRVIYIGVGVAIFAGSLLGAKVIYDHRREQQKKLLDSREK